MSATTESSLQQYQWEVQPAAAQWVDRVVEKLGGRNAMIARLGELLLENTGTRLVDWVDHLSIGDDDFAALRNELSDVGYESDTDGTLAVWRQPLGMFPTVLAEPGRVGMGIRCESVDDVLVKLPAALQLPEKGAGEAIGKRGGPFRKVCMDSRDGVELWAIERHGHPLFERAEASPEQIAAAAGHLDRFRRRERRAASCAEGFRHASQRIAVASDEIGTNWACDLFFQAEREYWQSRNKAARTQYERQNKLGLGWANHDHHTYRSSRSAFTSLIGVLEQMGFYCRERFYAGREAGWGAQVLEQPDCRIVIFADVDLSPEELAGDFAHEPLPERDELGTVGLWCELHGEAFLEAGMHHLECQFDFEAARRQLAGVGVESMDPFTNFEFLRQSFTRGEMWPVDPARIDRLVGQGRITSEQADRFRREGALGSHLEVLERNDGYKGFNQTGVSEIIARTDPRRAVGA